MYQLRYRALFLDHDDTAVDSTKSVHYPAFCMALRELRPGLTLDFESFIRYSSDPGFDALCTGILQFSAEEMQRQYTIWRSFATQANPSFFPGMRELLNTFQELGGHLVVVSHSEPEDILRAYQAADCTAPEKIYGWARDPEKRKPSPFPIAESLARLGLPPSAALVVDDLYPGLMMAHSCGVDFAGAGWAYQSEEVQRRLQEEGEYFCSSPQQLAVLLFRA